MNIHEARSCRITRWKARLGSFCLDIGAKSRQVTKWKFYLRSEIGLGLNWRIMFCCHILIESEVQICVLSPECESQQLSVCVLGGGGGGECLRACQCFQPQHARVSSSKRSFFFDQCHCRSVRYAAQWLDVLLDLY